MLAEWALFGILRAVHFFTIRLACLILVVYAAPNGVAMPAAFADGEVSVLATGGHKAYAPRWSPDGKWVAFALPGTSGLGVVTADGTGCRILTQEPGSGYHFSWAPDSSSIAFRSAVAAEPGIGQKRYRIRIVSLATGEIEFSTDALPSLQPPIWQTGPAGMRWAASGSPADHFGAWMPFPSSATEVSPPLVVYRDRNLWLGERKLSDKTGLHPRWSADATTLLFDCQDTIALIVPQALTPQPARMICLGQHPAWSPDGQWIVYQITRDHTHEGEDARQHTADTLPHLHDDKTNHQIVDSDLWLVRPDGTGRMQLTATPDIMEVDPHWSPDGRRIVCTTEDTGVLRLITFPAP